MNIWNTPILGNVFEGENFEIEISKESVDSFSFPDSSAAKISALGGRPRYVHRAWKWLESIWAIFAKIKRQMAFLGMKAWPGGKKKCGFST